MRINPEMSLSATTIIGVGNDSTTNAHIPLSRNNQMCRHHLCRANVIQKQTQKNRMKNVEFKRSFSLNFTEMGTHAHTLAEENPSWALIHRMGSADT